MRSRSLIVATIGPASGERTILDAMVARGMDVARINFSHGTHESDGTYIKNIKETALAANVRIPIILDLSGPRMKTDDGHGFDEGKGILTDKDLSDLDFGIAAGVDYIAQSYVGSGADVMQLRTEITKRGATLPIIAKIERQEGIDHFDDILAVSDAIMIARGDLGNAVPLEEIPFIKRDLIARTKATGKPVIVATQMLLSMTENITPTRAEVTDVVYAILAGADAVMLSEETTVGKHPAEVIAMMERIVARAEAAQPDTIVHSL